MDLENDMTINGINIGNYHSMLVEVQKIGLKSQGSIEVLCRGPQGTDPVLIFYGAMVDWVKALDETKRITLVVEGEMCCSRIDGYYFKVHRARIAKANKGEFVVGKKVLGLLEEGK